MKKITFQDKFVNHLWRILPPFLYTCPPQNFKIWNYPCGNDRKGLCFI